MKYRPAIDEINAMLKDPSPQVRAEAANTLMIFAQNLRSISRLGVPDSGKVFADNPPPDSPEGIADKRSVDALIPALRDKIHSVRGHAALALGWLRDQSAAGPLMQACGDQNPWVKRMAVIALGFLENSQACNLLMEMANDEKLSANIRIEAICSLGRIKDPRAIPSLNLLMQNKNKEISSTASEALLEMGEDNAAAWFQVLKSAVASPLRYFSIELALQKNRRAFEHSLSAISEQDPELQVWAVYALGRLKNPKAIPVLLNALQSSNHNVQGMAAMALAEFHDSHAVKPLIRLMKSPDWKVRAASALALGKIGDKSAVEPLVHGIKDPEHNVRQAAGFALGKIDPFRLRQIAESNYRTDEHPFRKAIAEEVAELTIEIIFDLLGIDH